MTIPSPGNMRFRDAEGELFYETPLEIVEAYAVHEVLPALDRIQHAVDKGAHAAGFLAYEAAPAFDAAFECHPPSGFPLLYFGLYELPMRKQPSTATPVQLPKTWAPLLNEETYRHTVEEVRDHIAAGDTYQVNYTFPLEAEFSGQPDAVFDALCKAQGKPKGMELRACVHTGRYSVLSVSPEVFFELEDGLITVRPMKGTRRRGRYPEEDRRYAQVLRESPKERAENLMIVDLLRNDLGRIAKTGSVRVRNLFQVQQWPTVWQMTSTIDAKTSAGISEIFAALFPSGSVTGAPKINTMRLIRRYEPWPRGVYCGAIGYITPQQKKACFNVAIRTLTIDRENQRARYPIGSGITWDSSAHDEYQECLDKARVLSYTRPEFSLLETMRLENGGIELLPLHLKRLFASAEHFDIPHDPEAIREELRRCCETSGGAPQKLRVLLAQSGTLKLEAHPLPGAKPWRVALAHTPVRSDNLYLFHKTTHRDFYDEKRGERPDCDDVILWNERGELTEATYANIVFQLDGKLFTPPVSSGLLGGVFRQKLLDEGALQEKILFKADLQNAQSVQLINAVRGWIDVEVYG